MQILQVYNAYDMIRHSNYVSIVSGSTNKVLGNVTVGQGTVSPALEFNIFDYFCIHE